MLLLAAVRKASGQSEDCVLDLADAEGEAIGTLKGLPAALNEQHDVFANSLLEMGAAYVLVKIETAVSEESGEESLVYKPLLPPELDEEGNPVPDSEFKVSS
eukprot:SAG31_NODE_3421_length_4296_cov_2.302121_1_plen_102_part_00